MQVAEMRYGKRANRHLTVRIPRGVCEAIEEFLTTEEAVRMGFDSKADVVTAAVRDLLIDFGVIRLPAKAQSAQP